MNAILCGLMAGRSAYQGVRSISLSSISRVKEIIESRSAAGTLEIGATVSEHPRAKFLVQNVEGAKPVCGAESGESIFCPECTLGLNIKHTDVLILKQYVRSDGCMLPRRITGLCMRQQRRIGTMVTMAQKAGLMPNIAPAHSKRDPKKRYQWKKYNKYFDETTIRG